MTFLTKPILGLILGAILLATSGCSTNPNKSGMPWSKPAGWENNVPGMDAGGFGR